MMLSEPTEMLAWHHRTLGQSWGYHRERIEPYFRSGPGIAQPVAQLTWSPFITAPYHTLLFLPTSTVPMMLAEGAMKQESAITGFLSATAITSRCRFTGVQQYS